MESRAHCDPAAVERLVGTITALGSILIPNGDKGLDAFQCVLQAINDRRQVLTRTHARILVQAKTWAAEASGRKAELEIRIADLIENDSEVRSAPTKDARLSRARAKSLDAYRSVVAAKKEQAVWSALLEICDRVADDLKLAKESVSRLIHLAEMQALNAGMLQRR